ncbi:MAG: hypothetical protein ACUZ8H_05055 [Candidatus Anammoxibacter sp.]
MKVKNVIMRKCCLALLIILASLMICANAQAQTWNIETPDHSKSFFNFYSRSIALDSSGNPHIAYGGEHLMVAHGIL